uniref:VWFA domain-containing protein n=1 Tax=Panagrolaimus superbus TaxID=310955 RepID=A0A914XUH7_9BILA
MGVPGEFVFQVDSNVIATPPPITRPTRPTLPPTSYKPTAVTTSRPPQTTATTSKNGLDRNCGCTRNKIWLDIVAVMDNSLSMGREGFSQVQSNLASIVGELSLNTAPGYSSRIALVSFASSAINVADLNTFNDTTSFNEKLFAIPLANDDKVNILSGLQMANTILGKGVVSNRRRVVILYTSAYDDTGSESPVSLSLNMREDNIRIITVAFSQKMGSDEVNKVGKLAWPTYNFTNEQLNLQDRMYDALCQTNCFCPPNWQQYTTDITNQYSSGYGVCLYLSSITSAWIPASYGCGTEAPGAYLVTETTEQKHDFNLGI